MSIDFKKPLAMSMQMLPMTGLRMKQRLVMTPELSADTNEGAKMARETIRNRYKLQQTLSDQDEDELDK